jgi:glycine/serine hydroxymethyltransferase
MKESEMKQIAQLIDRGIKAAADETELARISEDVKALCSGFLLYS